MDPALLSSPSGICFFGVWCFGGHGTHRCNNPWPPAARQSKHESGTSLEISTDASDRSLQRRNLVWDSLVKHCVVECTCAFWKRIRSFLFNLCLIRQRCWHVWHSGVKSFRADTNLIFYASIHAHDKVKNMTWATSCRNAHAERCILRFSLKD